MDSTKANDKAVISSNGKSDKCLTVDSEPVKEVYSILVSAIVVVLLWAGLFFAVGLAAMAAKFLWNQF